MSYVIKKQSQFSQELTNTLNRTKEITSLTFDKVCFDYDFILSVANFLRSNTTITSLKFYDINILRRSSKSNFHVVFDALLSNTTLQKLKFKGDKEENDILNMSSFTKYVCYTSTLRKLSFTKHKYAWTSTTMWLFARALSFNSSIRKLKLSEFKIQKEHYQLLFGSNSLLNLSHLSLNSVKMSVDSVSFVKEYIERTNLVSFSLNENTFSPDVLISIISSVTCSNISMFSAINCYGDIQSTEHIIDLLIKNKNLKEINLRSHYLRIPEHLYDIIEQIACNNYLRNISLFHLQRIALSLSY